MNRQKSLKHVENGIDINEEYEQNGSLLKQSDVQPLEIEKQQSEWHHPIPAWTRAYYVGISCLITAMLYADQNLTAPNLTAIADDFGFDHTQRDQLVAATTQFLFFVVGALFALPVGYLTDKWNRKLLLVIVVLVGTGPCILMMAVTQFWQFLLLRVLTGISLGSAPPLIFSLLSDLFIVSQRNYISALVAGSMGVGTLVGQSIAGYSGERVGWKLPFVIVAVPTIFVAILLLFTMKEVPRAVSEEAMKSYFASHEDFVYKESPDMKKFVHIFKIKTNILIIIQSVFGCVPWGMMQTYMNDFLSKDKGLGNDLATSVIAIYGVGLGIGLVLGGVLGQKLYNYHKEYVTVMMGTSVMLGAIPILILINIDLVSTSMHIFAFILAFFGGLLASISTPNIRPIVVNVNLPEVRGMALALQTTLDDLGKGLGPGLIGIFAGVMGREARFTVATLGWIPCGMLLLGLAYTIRKDETSMQHQLENVVEMQEGVMGEQDSSTEMTETSRTK